MSWPDLPSAATVASLTEALQALGSVTVPTVTSLAEATGEPSRTWRDCHSLVTVSGSFNPLHWAHLELLACGVETVSADAGAFILSPNTIDKARPLGMDLSDRAWTMQSTLDWAGHHDPRLNRATLSGLLVSHGLYVDQARALRHACTNLHKTGLWFVVGFDKIVQIFDPRYYTDRTSSLDTLFDMAGFLVAPRDEATPADLADLLDLPQNLPYATRIRPIELPATFATVASTGIRARATLGTTLSDDVPPPVASMIKTRRCY